jgi:murein L,D-transpeptidase YcbB/YkuD
VVESGKTRFASLHEPVPVLLLYWTAWVGSDGRVNFRPDLYGRDKLVQQGLASGFRFRKRPAISEPWYNSQAIPLEGRDVG